MFDYSLFLIQIAVIVGVSRVAGFLFQKLHQPQVVGEMAAGIILGPTVFGLFAPGPWHSLFPPASLGFLNALSQAGLVVFVFLVGVRVDFGEMRRQAGMALVTSSVSVMLPLVMGIGLAQYLYPRYGTGNPLAFALFIGTAMSVTAFPVLARILIERGLLETRLGSIAIACAAVGDMAAWILLAVLVTLTTHDRNARPVWLMLVYAVAFMGLMLVLGRVLRRWSRSRGEKKLPADSLIGFVVLALVAGAVGEWIGIHALVGAFAAGLATPREFRSELIDKLETFTMLLFMPLFFALTGIRTNLIFHTGGGAYFDLVLIMLTATACKWGGTVVAARAKGMDWREASQLGLMMNTRGLVELIVLNVGLESGVIPPPLFSMMVCMALVTTFMATPLMDLFAREKPRAVAA